MLYIHMYFYPSSLSSFPFILILTVQNHQTSHLSHAYHNVHSLLYILTDASFSMSDIQAQHGILMLSRRGILQTKNANAGRPLHRREDHTTQLANARVLLEVTHSGLRSFVQTKEWCFSDASS